MENIIHQPTMTDEAWELLKKGEVIEIPTESVFAFKMVIKNHERRDIKFKTTIDKHTKGFTTIKL